MNDIPATSWKLDVWLDAEPNSQWNLIHADRIDPGDFDDGDAAEMLDIILDGWETAGEYRLRVLNAYGVVIDSAEGELTEEEIDRRSQQPRPL